MNSAVAGQAGREERISHTEAGKRGSGEAGKRGSGEAGWGERLLREIAESNILAEKGVFILEERADTLEKLPSVEGWGLVTRKVYGETGLNFFRKTD